MTEPKPLPRKICRDCLHWRRGWLDFCEGYARAICSLQGAQGVAGTVPLRRASESCASWKKNDLPKAHEHPMLF